MANLCRLCDKEISFLGGGLVADIPVCNDCFNLCNEILNSEDDEEFHARIEELEENCNDSKEAKEIIEYLKDLHMSYPCTTKNADDSNSMFNNIGGKIKTSALILSWIGIIASIIIGFFLMATDEDLILYGFIVAVLGTLVSWVSSFTLYGFGQLIENTDKLVELSKNNTKK